jgi:hypothetical protein
VLNLPWVAIVMGIDYYMDFGPYIVVRISASNGWVGPIFEKESPYPIEIAEFQVLKLVNTRWTRSTRSTLKIYF